MCTSISLNEPNLKKNITNKYFFRMPTSLSFEIDYKISDSQKMNATKDRNTCTELVYSVTCRE